MLKFGLMGCMALSILILGVALPDIPPGSNREPVPSSQKVAHSSHCSGCHGFDETGMALVDADGHDVNVFDDWQISMMGLSAHDPFWRATVSHEVHLFPGAKAAIEATCLKCHSPIGSFQAHLNGVNYSMTQMLSDSLGLDGVSCSSCHQQPAKDLGKGHSGNFTIDTNRVLFGQLPNPFKGPMQIYVGFEPAFSDHIYDSGVCSGCHTLITETLDTAGAATGNFFVEQATYHEWLNSIYPQQGKQCQTCHLPFIPDDVIIATDFLALEGRQPYGLHQFFGGNTAMLTLMHQHQDTLHLPKASSDMAWTESISNNRISLHNAATIEIDPVSVFNDTLYIHLSIKNKTGHKFPSGYPSRLSWLQLVLTDHKEMDTIYANGLLDVNGHITGRDFPVEQHHEIIRSADEVQVYELAMADATGDLTTRLNGAFEPLKDNRLLPTGFRKTHASYDTVAIWGNALSDPDFDELSIRGLDEIEYRIPLNGRMGSGDLRVSLHYQTMPARWMEDLFTNDTVPQIGHFKSMYQDYTTFDEIIDSIQLKSIDLNSVGIQNPSWNSDFKINPNPISGTELFLSYPEQLDTRNLQYHITNQEGVLIQKGRLSQTIHLQNKLPGGVYFLQVLDREDMMLIKPFLSL